MTILLTDAWCWLCISMAIFLLTAFIMGRQSRYFYTMDVVPRQFSIMDLELPSCQKEMVNLIKGIYAMPPANRQLTLRALRGQLWVDFLFMPAAYGSIFLVCMKVASKMNPAGMVLFHILAWLQLLCWLCDIIENIYLLQKIGPNISESTKMVHRAYQALEMIKWGFSLLGIVCGLSALLFFWVTGNFDVSSLHYLLIIVGEIVIFMVLQKLLFRAPIPAT
ncbi:hypothetical protein HGH93_05730 [Chitinophaga polysaccharea]|uniref:hypothetical protein n=1 Tax=Chitinophaga polysaccharea TaxID=1293035 RepID=UPI00145577C2|nr:hypothetical protein [Chitinophaga polysaccharea]NLR57588.1 hypothetical protein [Chitinophaga polysaccharea]